MSEQLSFVTPLLPGLTAKQQAVLDFITEYIAEHGYAPSTNDISGHFNIYTNAAISHINALVKKGYLLKTPRVTRGMSLPKHNNP